MVVARQVMSLEKAEDATEERMLLQQQEMVEKLQRIRQRSAILAMQGSPTTAGRDGVETDEAQRLQEQREMQMVYAKKAAMKWRGGGRARRAGLAAASQATQERPGREIIVHGPAVDDDAPAELLSTNDEIRDDTVPAAGQEEDDKEEAQRKRMLEDRAREVHLEELEGTPNSEAVSEEKGTACQHREAVRSSGGIDQGALPAASEQGGDESEAAELGWGDECARGGESRPAGADGRKDADAGSVVDEDPGPEGHGGRVHESADVSMEERGAVVDAETADVSSAAWGG